MRLKSCDAHRFDSISYCLDYKGDLLLSDMARSGPIQHLKVRSVLSVQAMRASLPPSNDRCLLFSSKKKVEEKIVDKFPIG